MVNAELLKAEIEDLGIPKQTLAEKCGVTRKTLDNWMDNPSSISAKGAKSLADALRITDPEKLLSIFFAPNVQENLNE